MTEIESFCADANAKDALVPELQRTFTTTRTESEALCFKVNALRAFLARKCDAAEWSRVDSAQRAFNAKTRAEILPAELALERAAVADHKKEVCALAGQLKDSRQRYKDNRDKLLADLDDADLDADKWVDVMQQRIVLLAHAIKQAEAGRTNTLDCVVVE